MKTFFALSIFRVVFTKALITLLMNTSILQISSSKSLQKINRFYFCSLLGRQKCKNMLQMNLCFSGVRKTFSSCLSVLPLYTVKSQIFVRYPFSYFWLETGSYELISVLSRASKQNYIEIRWPQDKNKFSSGIKFRTFVKSTKVRN